MFKVERNSIEAIIDYHNSDRRDVINEGEHAWILHGREENSPEEKSNDDLKREGSFIEKDAPLPEEPW